MALGFRSWRLALTAIITIAIMLLGIIWDRTGSNTVGSATGGQKTVSIYGEVENIFNLRVQALISGDTTALANYYDNTETTGRWALNHEIGRTKYLHEWLGKRNLELMGSELQVRIVDAGLRTDTQAWASVSQHLILRYRKRSLPPSQVSQMGLRTIHWVELIHKDNKWLIQKDWYWDPLEADDLVPDIAALPPESLSPTALGAERKGKYNREAAVLYADRYSGVRLGSGDGRYNPAYKDFTYEGGDCANFASQVLTDKQAGGIPTDGAWFYSQGKGTKAWVQAEALVYHLIYSGLAVLIKRGNFQEVSGVINYLDRGDIIGYEEKGEIVHVSIVVGKDAGGYVVVDSHTADRYHVPWDMGWEKKHLYWLLHITY
ncbi:MAG: amidase domain-containing protein [Moorellaceae bacterium]